MSDKLPMIVIAVEMLKAAGHAVTPADGVPGLWNVGGLARDVTIGQLAQLAAEHGEPWQPDYHLPAVNISSCS